MTKFTNLFCLLCNEKIETLNIKESINDELNQHVEKCLKHQEILKNGVCDCGKKPKGPLILHLKSRHFYKSDSWYVKCCNLYQIGLSRVKPYNVNSEKPSQIFCHISNFSPF